MWGDRPRDVVIDPRALRLLASTIVVPAPALVLGSIAPVVLGAVGVLIGLTAIATTLWRRRQRLPAPPLHAAAPPSTDPPPRPAIAVVRSRRRATSAGLEIATSGMVCPTCRTEYTGMIYCQRDARRLVSAEDMLEGRAAGGMCARCGRGFDPGLRRCPHDGTELVPPNAYRATRKADPPLTGVLGKACPVCRHRYDLSVRFCGRDGHDLVVVN